MNSSRLRPRGFAGFATIGDLSDGAVRGVPQQSGVYAVLRVAAETPRFLSRNPGGRFKGKDPTVPVELLERRWVVGTEVLYFGKADDLRRRIHQLCRFGRREPVGHWGGRLIWQVEGSDNFLVAWLPTPNSDPFVVERELMHEFRALFGVWPFANIQGQRRDA